jgi:hypothetical protein
MVSVIIPFIFAVGIAGTAVLVFTRHRKNALDETPACSTPHCSKCDAVGEDDWTYCVKCGAHLVLGFTGKESQRKTYVTGPIRLLTVSPSQTNVLIPDS